MECKKSTAQERKTTREISPTTAFFRLLVLRSIALSAGVSAMRYKQM